MAGGTLALTMSSGAGASTLQVLFGDQSELAAKLTALATLTEKTDLSGTAQIDLRVPYRPALTPVRPEANLSTQAGGGSYLIVLFRVRVGCTSGGDPRPKWFRVSR